MNEAGQRLEAALEEWFERSLAGESIDAEAFARERGIALADLLPRVENARWLVARGRRRTGGEPAIPKPPFPLGEFDVLEEAGRGAMGIVFKARHRASGEPVAVKLLPASELLDARAHGRFLHEAKAMAALSHKGIVPVLAAGEEGGLAWYAMAWIEGETLAAVLDRRRRASLRCTAGYARECAALVAAVGRALGHAHEHGLLHRDVKPGNILVDRQGQPHLVDFGLAKNAAATAWTATGDILGSPAYMSPEQLRGERDLDGRADVYALGVTLYECLTLRRPHDTADLAALQRSIDAGRYVPPRQVDALVPAALERVAVRAMAAERGARYARMSELVEDLEAFVAGRAVRPRRLALLPRARGLWRRRRGAVLAAAGLLLVAAVGFVALASQRAVAAQHRLADKERLVERLLDQRLFDTLEGQTILADVDRAVAESPDDAELRLLRAVLRLEADQGTLGREDLSAALRLVADPWRGIVAATVAAATRPALTAGELRQSVVAEQRRQGGGLGGGRMLLLLAELLLRGGRADLAEELLRAVPPLDSRLHALAACGMATCQMLIGRRREARDALAALTKLFPSPARLYHMVRMSAASDAAQATADAAALRARYPDSDFNLAAELLLADPRQTKEPAIAAILARQRRDDPAASGAVLAALLNLHYLAGRFDAALVVGQQRLVSHPHDPNLRGMLGSILFQQGKREEALAELERAARDGNGRPYERDVHWATYHYHAGDYEKAVQHNRSSTRICPADPTRWRALGGALSALAETTGDPAAREALLREWVDACEREVALVPKGRRGLQLLAHALATLGRFLRERGADFDGVLERKRAVDAALRR